MKKLRLKEQNESSYEPSFVPDLDDVECIDTIQKTIVALHERLMKLQKEKQYSCSDGNDMD